MQPPLVKKIIVRKYLSFCHARAVLSVYYTFIASSSQLEEIMFPFVAEIFMLSVLNDSVSAVML